MSFLAFRPTAGVLAALALLSLPAPAQEAPGRPPDAVVDLATSEGAQAVKGAWRYHDARLVEVEFRSPGPDRKPSGPPNRTLEFEPRAGARDFDDSAWAAIPADRLNDRVSTGRVCFGWYRIRITVPERVGEFPTAGSRLLLEIHVDDYAEVWVDGRLEREPGQAGGSLIAGFNVPNRLLLSRDALPGSEIQVAVFAANGPLSDPPPNFLWIRRARLEFRRAEPARIERLDPAFDEAVPPGSALERVAGGFTWVEGPLWDPALFRLLFSDIPRNAVFAWRGGGAGGADLLLQPSGYSGTAPFRGREPGSNGLAFDRQGRLLLCQHGDRRIARLEADGRLSVVADRYAGKRLNSPNDIAVRSNGDLYFTDPPFGLPETFDDPARELPHCGVYRVDGRGEVTLLTAEVSVPNGIALSPDERTLYVSNADRRNPVWLAFPIREEGTLGPARTLADARRWIGERPGGPDGIKCDRKGHLFAAGPGGIYVLAPDGRHLGTLLLGVPTSNCAFDDSQRTLYITADTGIWRLRLGGGR